MTLGRLTLAILVLSALPRLVLSAAFDAEADIGLVANNPAPTIAARNTALLTSALEAQWAGGKFKFVNGQVGPILYPIQCAAKQFFFAGTIQTSQRIGGVLCGAGGRSYIMPEGEYSPAGVTGGSVTRFSRIDGEKGGPILRLRGVGFILDGISLLGRRWPGGKDLAFQGAKAESCIEVEGRAVPASGSHTIRNCLLAQAKYGIRALAGHYDAKGAFIKDENHADQVVVESVTFSGVESGFRSENQQAVGWSFRDIHADQDAEQGDIVLFDIVRGGDIDADNLILNHNKVTLFKVHDYSPNNRRLVCQSFRFDGAYTPEAYLTLFKYSGPIHRDTDMSWIRWSARIAGTLPGAEAANGKSTFDASKLVVFADEGSRVGIDRKDLLFDVAGLPTNGFVSAGGPWMRPK
jgi:hypothetical protein